jgi:hypothetical protein
MKLAALLAALFLVLVAGIARADIFEWRDADGTRHFTNNKGEVPSAGQARVMITEPPASPGVAAPVSGPVEQPREAPVVYDYSRVRDAYIDGLQQGLALARGGGGVRINGPLAVAGARGGSVVVPAYEPFYYPFVTTSFDRGRSRHLTLRMLLQDQFQLDRDGPFLYERLPTGMGPALSPFLPRGLPQGFPRGSRVLF